MKSGRKPTPRALQILRGNPGKRRIREDLDLAPGVPDAPKWLDAPARLEWDYVVGELGPAKVLRKVDRTILAGYCCSVSRALRAEARARHDVSQEARAEKAWDAVRKFGALFGLGPAESVRVKAAMDAQDDKAARFLA
jgi:phage terminase small subunit